MKYLIEYYIRVGEYEKAARLIQNKTVKAAILDMGRFTGGTKGSRNFSETWQL